MTTVLSVVLAGSAWAGVGKMDSAPVWEAGGLPRAVSDASPFEIPHAVIDDVTAFTVEARLRFDAKRTSGMFFPLFDAAVSETGWGVGLLWLDGFGNPVMLLENGRLHYASYAMGGVKPGSEHSFTLAVRDGWIVVYMDGKVQRSFIQKIVPNLAPITMGRIVKEHWEGPGLGQFVSRAFPMEGVTLLGLKVWDGREKYYAPGEPREPASGYTSGKGWMMEVPTREPEKLPRLLYCGDSISDGYTPALKAKLAGKAYLYHWSVCQNTIGKFDEAPYLDVGRYAKYDAIVFNNGLHSLHWTEDRVTDAQIAESYRQQVRAFRACSPGAKITYLTTTPFTQRKTADGKIPGLGDKNAVVLRLNRIARQVMAEEKVDVLDAYALFEHRLDEARGDQYHWNPSAYVDLAAMVGDKFLADCTARSAREELAERLVKVRSTYDGTLQPCYFYAPEKAATQEVPLIVGLHTWSYDWRMVENYVPAYAYAKAKGWAMVGPDFRGPNNRAEACGGDAAVQDIVDAVNYAKSKARIDAKRIYITGGSGGGHMTLLMAGRHPEIWAGCAAFCPISDLARWHADSLLDHPGRGKGYANMLERACGGTPADRPEEYAHRSPLTWLARAREAGVPVYIATGIHDGWKGSVPVGHAFRAFNALAGEADRVSEAEIAAVEETQRVPEALAFRGAPDPFYGERMGIHFRRTSGNVRFTLFEGGHSGNYPAGLDFLSRQVKGRPADFSLPGKATGADAELSR